MRREAGGRLDQVLTAGRGLLTGNHDQQCEGLVFLARLAGANGQRPPGTEQSATDCRWRWSTPRRSQRRIWEIKTRPAKASTAGTRTAETRADKSRADKGQEVTGGGQRKIARGDVNQLLGQLEVEQRRAPKARLYGCLVDQATDAERDAIDAAGDRIRFVSHEAAVRLYDCTTSSPTGCGSTPGSAATAVRTPAATPAPTSKSCSATFGALLPSAQALIHTLITGEQSALGRKLRRLIHSDESARAPDASDGLDSTVKAGLNRALK